MIISVSRRTDIPAFYADWFFNRLQEGFVCVRNPMNHRQVSRIVLSPDRVDGMVFWTKNPRPVLDRLSELARYPYYFQCTITPYGRDMEPFIPDKNRVVIPAFQELSRRIGPKRVIWRYDPVILTGKYTISYHIRVFTQMAARLSGYTQKCIISFADDYAHIRRPMAAIGQQPITREQMLLLAEHIAGIATRHHMTVETCAEQVDLGHLGISHGHCIDRRLLENISGYPLAVGKDPYQREACGCAASVDIGAYNTCPGGCRYCYAVKSPARAEQNRLLHDPHSPLLFGKLGPEDVVKDRQGGSDKISQLHF